LPDLVEPVDLPMEGVDAAIRLAPPAVQWHTNNRCTHPAYDDLMAIHLEETLWA